jgi:serine/threonine-protein kinase
MGQVYLARDTRLNRSVALKIVQPDPNASEGSGQSDSGGAARLLREAQSAAALQHPNVVVIYEVGTIKDGGEDSGRPFIAMELVKGKALRAFVGDAAVPLDTRLKWLADVARALSAAHDAGLVHRDIKPENVMVSDTGVVKVLDFGLAKRAAMPAASSTSSTEAQVLPSLTAKGVAIGTPYYMAPEQMRREPLDGRADQFAWGVLAYELLGGAAPWGKDVDALELVSKILTQNPSSLDDVNPEVPRHVARAVARAMSKSRGDRFASMNELLATLDPAAKATTPPADTTSKPVQAQTTIKDERPPQRRMRLAIAAGLVVAIAAGGLALKRQGTTTAAAPDAAPARECTKPSECTKKVGKPAVCNPSGKCAELASVDCEVRADPVAQGSENTVWFGTMFPKGDEDLQGDFRGVDLGRQDFAQMMSGFAEAKGDAPVHPFGLVACDDSADLMRAARHLVEDVQVPAIIGFRSSAEIVDVGNALLIPNGVAAVIPLSTSPLVTSLYHRPGQPRLVWRTTFSSAQAAKAIGHFVPDVLETRLRADTSKAPLKVALVRDKSRGGATFDALLLDALRFNGKSAIANGDDFRRFIIDGSVAARVEEEARAAVEGVNAFAPNVIIYSADIAEVRYFVEPLERIWSHGATRPTYVQVSHIMPDVMPWVGSSAERRRRFFGLVPLAMTSVNARLVLHYNETFGTRVTPTYAPNSAYDAFYLLAYATYALGDKPITGVSLAHGIERLLPPGKPIDVGMSGIFEAYAALRHGEKIDLNGAFGSLDFDTSTGEAPFKHAIECVGLNDKGVADHGVESGVVYASETDKLEGTLRCP